MTTAGVYGSTVHRATSQAMKCFVDRPYWLVTAGRDTEKVNHPDLVLVCCSKPLVVGSIRGAPHERIVDAETIPTDS